MTVVDNGSAVQAYYYFVFAEPADGQEARFNKWYEEQHQRDVVSIPGFVSVQRFVMNDIPLYKEMDVKLPKYLAVYKLITDDIDGVFKEVSERLRTGRTKMDPSFDAGSYVGYTYRSFRPFVDGAGGEAPDAQPGRKELFYHVVFTPFKEGMEEQFNEIYDKFHAPELAANPAFTGAQRMMLARPDTARIKATKYLALFTIETSDMAAVKKVAILGGTPNPAQDYKATRGYTYRALGLAVDGDRVRAEQVGAPAAISKPQSAI